MTLSAEAAITHLLQRYARLLDAGELTAVAELFDRADILVSGTQIGAGSDFVEQLLRDTVIIHADGTPGTRHIVTPRSFDFEGDRRVTVHSDYTVLQPVLRPGEVVMVGRHHDTLVLDAGGWHFDSRDYGDITYVGDTSAHLRS
ncbi:nuclear transport factor 2 family protein [Gordonia sp. (in: high G+C Gram-positive bacteria)]|uniref:nuclear transport factor 2 family protein n=1 Tax=Gordonia sp. (in: high G+C Gram-positive bacteria) TaxID=84139 RepID=UPI0035B31362